MHAVVLKQAVYYSSGIQFPIHEKCILVARSALRFIENAACLSLFQHELQCDNVGPSCCNVISLLERAEGSHSVFGN